MYATSSALTVHREANLGRDIVRLVATVLFPPLGVFLKMRFTAHLMISVLLTLFGYIPGLIHALWVLAKRPDDLWPNRR
ncbi:MAG: YqaE/Pmp3 family membrane protein [Myxococcales bacterium]|nr:YqaE/Pmp3 family membrane protein [Myxococcales bacterium]MCB9652201.1 YqaE/Pmp3 family membrane protein [Deltaproteobacteria bacterium]